MKYTIDTEEILNFKTSEREAVNYLVEELQPCISAIERTNKDDNTYNRLKEMETIREFLGNI